MALAIANEVTIFAGLRWLHEPLTRGMCTPMRLPKVFVVILSGTVGAVIGGALLAAGSNVQAVGWHPGFPIAGALSGAAVGMGMACRQVRVTTAAALVGASIPSAIEELSFDDGGLIVIPLFGALVGWTAAAFSTWRLSVVAV